jgi:hypothetical protein
VRRPSDSEQHKSNTMLVADLIILSRPCNSFFCEGKSRPCNSGTVSVQHNCSRKQWEPK